MIHRICVQFIWRLVLMLCFLELFATSINGTENSRKRHLDNYQENPRSQKRQRLNGDDAQDSSMEDVVVPTAAKDNEDAARDGKLISGYIQENYEIPQRSVFPDALKKPIGEYYKYVPLKDKIILSMSTKSPLKPEILSDLDELFNAKRSEEPLTLNLGNAMNEDDSINEDDIEDEFEFSLSFSFDSKIFTNDDTTDIMFTLFDLPHYDYTADETIYLIAENLKRSMAFEWISKVTDEQNTLKLVSAMENLMTNVKDITMDVYGSLKSLQKCTDDYANGIVYYVVTRNNQKKLEFSLIFDPVK
eukprot:913131_1